MNKKILLSRSFYPSNADTANNCQLSSELPALLKKIYIHRGITHENQINYALSALLKFHDLLNIHTAVALLAQGIQAQKKILIIGDFDSDGATSTALAVKALQAFGAKQVNYLIPNRFEYGYGLTPEIVDTAQERFKPDILITVDNGISSHAGVLRAHTYGMQVLITDHHLPGKNLPVAEVIVNPNQPNDQFASKNLAGVGVIFYVMLALRDYLKNSLRQNITVNMAQFLDLVALGTVADVVLLDQNNRILVYQGLLRIRHQLACPGIQALLLKSQRESSQLTTSDLAFALAPRLNAAGRLDDMSLGVECLLSHDRQTANQLATQLDQLNKDRRLIETDMLSQAEKLLENIRLDTHTENIPAGICLYHADFHQGVIGILAGRLKERYHRPVIVFSKISSTELKGSARSITGVHLRDLLALIHTKNPAIISQFGGHAMAAGLTIPLKNLAVFSALFTEYLEKILTPEISKNILFTDGELTPAEFSTATIKLFEALPWGQGFPAPLFEGKFQVLKQMLLQDKHLKLCLQLHDHAGCIYTGIMFNYGKLIPDNTNIIHIAYRLDLNDYQGMQNIQLIIEHI